MRKKMEEQTTGQYEQIRERLLEEYNKLEIK